MKLERISENQIRCTLNKNDLIDRELKLSELAYGTEKARELFKEVMAQASDELGFEANDIPLIIEAIPVSGDCIILIVTKIDDPEELDTRFARFAPGGTDEDEAMGEAEDRLPSDTENYIGADEILDIFKEIQEKLIKNLTDISDDGKATETDKGSETDTVLTAGDTLTSTTDQMNITRMFSFSRLSDIFELSGVLTIQAPTESAVYKHPKTGRYYLVMEKGDMSPEDFNKICNISTEYGQRENFTYATRAYFEEHYETIIKKNALNILSQI